MTTPNISLKIANPVSLRFLMIVALLEIFLGGGGRLIDIGPLSLRMYLFMLTFSCSLMMAASGAGLNKNFFYILLSATLLLLISSWIGYANDALIKAITDDVKPLLAIYFLMFLYFTIKTEADVMLVVQLIRVSAVVLACLYIVTFVLINFKLIPFRSFYDSVASSEEFFFRGEFAFFYKGFVYMCVGLFFFLMEKKVNKLIVTILVLAIVLTFTRGFIVAIVLTYLAYLLFIKKSGSRIVLYSLMISIVIISLWSSFHDANINRQASDSARIIQVQEVVHDVTPLSIFIGHGFGIGVPSRPDKMEIAYLEIFHKQGLMGISFWVILLALTTTLYKSVRGENRRLASAFLLAVVVIYVQSFTNPYVNNPIGITMILLSCVCLNVLANNSTGDGQENGA